MEKKEAMKILKDFHDKSALFSVRTALETLHPELKESEDERMVNQLHSWMNEFGGAEEYTEKVYQWLKGLIEKQGKEKPLSENEHERVINALKEGFKYHQLFNPTFGGIPCIEIVNWLEKQGEQKPADKVEPKFKVKYAGNEYNVLDIKENMGITWYGIEDEPNHIDYVKANSCEIINVYGIKENGSPYPTKPAIFAGHNPSDEDMKEALRTEYEKGRADAFAQMQKEWSEEDESIALGIEQIVNCASLLNIAPDKLNKVRDWLKSIKERIGE